MSDNEVRTEIRRPEQLYELRDVVQRFAREHHFGHRDLDASLVVSELVTNALRHGVPPVQVVLDADRAVLRVTVIDGGGGMPSLVDTEPDATSGRGLQIVDALSRCWGARVDDARTVVWAELEQQ